MNIVNDKPNPQANLECERLNRKILWKLFSNWSEDGKSCMHHVHISWHLSVHQKFFFPSKYGYFLDISCQTFHVRHFIWDIIYKLVRHSLKNVFILRGMQNEVYQINMAVLTLKCTFSFLGKSQFYTIQKLRMIFLKVNSLSLYSHQHMYNTNKF